MNEKNEMCGTKPATRNTINLHIYSLFVASTASSLVQIIRS